MTALSIRPQDGYVFAEGSFAEKYTVWELALRHSILRLRTQKNQAAQESVAVKREPVFECDADSVAIRAYSAANPLERERILDEARWTKADELTVLHQFDLDVLCAYRIKLEIAEKWSARAAGDPEKNMDLCAAALEEKSGKKR